MTEPVSANLQWRHDADVQHLAASPAAQRKVNHLAALARALLPPSESIEKVHAHVERILGDVESDEDEELEFKFALEPPSRRTVSLKDIRMAAFEHQEAWTAGSVPAYKFAVGDLCHHAPDSDELVVLGSVLDEGLKPEFKPACP